MGRVAELNRDISQIQDEINKKTMNSETGRVWAEAVCLEHIAKSLAWYMDRTEKLDRYEPETTSDDGDLISRAICTNFLVGNLNAYAHSRFAEGSIEQKIILAIPMEEWIKEIPGGF